MREIAADLLLVIGAIFSLLAAVGVLRMPDFLMRLHTSTKAGTVGVVCILAGVVLWTGEGGVIARAVLTICFLLLTAPVAAHLLGRAGYFSGARVWEGTVLDEIAVAYEPDTHILRSRRAESPRRFEDDEGGLF